MNIKEYTNSSLNFIEINNGDFKVTFCDLGASIYSIFIDNKNMVMTPENSEDFLRDSLHHGKTIGRTGNRIKGNVIEIDGNKYKLQNNEDENTLHGGKNGLSTKFFKPTVKEFTNFVKVIYKYTSRNNESGFPGTLKVKITYLVPRKGTKLKVLFEAKTNKPTLCNLTNHAFFTLGSESVDELTLKINSDTYLSTDKDTLLPISKEKVSKELNFSRFKRISKYINSRSLMLSRHKGYDHNYYLLGEDNKPKVFLKNDDYLLKIKTDFECAQIYSDNYSNDIKFIGTNNNARRGLAIEPQDDYLNRQVLRPNEKYSRSVVYEFKKIAK